MKPCNILFIGNSYKSSNDMPKMFEYLAQRAGRQVDVTQIAYDGKTLEWHWYNSDTLKEVDKGRWDYVILQEDCIRSIEEPKKMKQAVIQLCQRIGHTNIALFMTWACQHMPERQNMIKDTCRILAEMVGISVAPVGLAWQYVLEVEPTLVLKENDRDLPSPLGSYLAACVCYTTIFDKSPVGLDSKIPLVEGATLVIDEGQAELLQQAAHAVGLLKKSNPVCGGSSA